METLIGILVLMVMAIGGSAALFLCVFQPIWGIIDVAVSQELSGAAKAVIILLTILLLGPIMTFFYGVFGTHSRIFKRATVAASLVLLFSGLAFISLAAVSSTARDTVEEVIPEELGPQI